MSAAIQDHRALIWMLMLCLDNKFIFPFGPLDQGFWPDGEPLNV